MNCPTCKEIGQHVSIETVSSLVQRPVKAAEFYLCPSSSCSVVYFNDAGDLISEESIGVPIWYKDSSPEVPICYCANLTRGEIIEADNEGDNTLAKVRKCTGKTQTGQCRTKNPSGRCCHKEVQKVIDCAKK
ncbi:hypothetical protein GEMRC1_011592 [Eukaryota sp. GEM-RC1]